MTSRPANESALAEAESEIVAIDADLGIDTAAFDRLLKETPVELHHTLVPPLVPKVDRLTRIYPTIN